jgi:hypothetical protein
MSSLCALGVLGCPLSCTIAADVHLIPNQSNKNGIQQAFHPACGVTCSLNSSDATALSRAMQAPVTFSGSFR